MTLHSLFALALLATCAFAEDPLTWKKAMDQKAPWYGSAEAIRVADNLLVYQHDNGGWKKNIDMAAPLDTAARAKLIAEKREDGTTIDNSATYTQMAYLARVYNAGKQERYKASFLRGLDFILKAQYDNGGWPQYYPARAGYWMHITYNDDAMVGVMEMLRAIVKPEPVYAFVETSYREKAARALDKAIECILKTQVVVNGKLTVWCAQHDEKTLAPAPARKYELISLSGSESVPIVRYLMAIDKPSPAVIRSVQSAMAWFHATKITGLKQVEKPAPGTPKGYDKTMVPDASAPPLWARFYDVSTNRPIFCGRDGIVKSSIAEIEYERRNGYRWYVDRPASLLERDYPKWLAKWAPGQDMRR